MPGFEDEARQEERRGSDSNKFEEMFFDGISLGKKYEKMMRHTHTHTHTHIYIYIYYIIMHSGRQW